MPRPNAEYVDSELERIRIELVMLRAEKVREDLNRLAQTAQSNDQTITPTDISEIDQRLQELEEDARKLVQSLPDNDAVQPAKAQEPPLVLNNPEPETRGYRIEEVMAKASHRVTEPEQSE